MPRLLAVVLASLVLLAGSLVLAPARPGGSTTHAQEATPIGTPVRDVPAPGECRVAPRSLASLQALATPVAGAVAPTASTGTALPPGEPADAATVAALTATAREVIACDNAGEALRALALYSDRSLRQHLGTPGAFTPERYATLATPRPVDPGIQVALVAVRDARLLPDGRAAAVVVVDDPTAGGQARSASILFFVEQDGRWLIDGAITDVEGGATGTPAA